MSTLDRLIQLKTAGGPQLNQFQRWLPAAVSVGLAALIAYQLAQITLGFLGGEDYSAPAPVSVNAAAPVQAAGGSSYAALAASHLFGTAARTPAAGQAPPPPPPNQIDDAPDTSLPLQLHGVIVRARNEDSEAVIVTGNQPDELYQVGDTITGASGATLEQVFSDRVILNRNGRFETLRRPEESAPASVARSSRPAPLPRAPQPQTTMRSVGRDDITRISSVIRFAPHVDGGEVVGFRVTPGQNGAAFESLGLQPGDVVTDINGVMLNDPSQGLEAFESLSESPMANVTVLRGGTPQVLVVDTSQLNDLGSDE